MFTYMARVEFRWSEDLLRRVDEARGDVPRAVWVRRAAERELRLMRWDAEAGRAVERALGARSEPPVSADAMGSIPVPPAPAEQPVSSVPVPRRLYPDHLPTCKCPVCSDD